MVNKVILLGNLGADPELKSTPSGQSVCSLRIATSEKYKDKDGNQQEKTEWHRVGAVEQTDSGGGEWQVATLFGM